MLSESLLYSKLQLYMNLYPVAQNATPLNSRAQAKMLAHVKVLETLLSEYYSRLE